MVACEEEEQAAAATHAPGQPRARRGWLPATGCIRLAVPSSKDPGQAVPAETRFRVLHQGPRLAWLELRPATVGARAHASLGWADPTPVVLSCSLGILLVVSARPCP